MNDDTETPVNDVKEAEPSGPLAGERLAEARREREISILEIAKELHLDEPKVRALEQNDFDVLGAPVFAKGYLRKYAQLVGISVDDVLADYYALNRSAKMPPVVGKVRRPPRELSPVPWIAVGIVLIIVAAAYWWFVVRPPVVIPGAPSTTPPITETDTGTTDDGDEPVSGVDTGIPEVTEAVEGAAEPPRQPPPDDAGVDTAPEAPAQVADEAAAATDGSGAAADGETVRLTIRFSGDCWTEITDASGERLFFELGREGREVAVSGEAPLSILFGNADNVSLTVDGDAYAIPASARRGQTARLTIFAP